MRPDESFVGQPIRSLQTMLRTIAQTDPRQVSVIPDGVYSPQTTEAVRSFQENNGLESTGAADQDTWERIVEAFKPANVEVSPAQPIYISLNPGQTFAPGDRHHHLTLVQAMLNLLTDVWKDIPKVGYSGILDGETEAALRYFQRLSQLPVTGVLDKNTWKHLVLHHANAANILDNQVNGP